MLAAAQKPVISFNRRGDSLGGATGQEVGEMSPSGKFQSQRRFFGGSNIESSLRHPPVSSVSIAEAILWGEQRSDNEFTRVTASVSIAEAILWGEQPYHHPPTLQHNPVSIAEAILWGEQHCAEMMHMTGLPSFNRRGDSLGGATLDSKR